VICALLLARALAAPLEAFPFRAEVTLPDGPVRIAVPLALRSPEDPLDGTDLLLVNGAGDEIPFVRVEGDLSRWTPVEATAAPTSDPERFEVTPERRVDRIRVELPPDVAFATAEVWSGGERVVAPTEVWGTIEEGQPVVPVPGLTAPFTLVVTPRRGGALDDRAPAFGFDRAEGLRVPPETFPLTLEGPRLQENGWARWTARLERPVPVDRVRLETDARNLSRAAGTTWAPWHPQDGGWYEPFPDRQTALLVRRSNGDDVVRESLELPVPTGPAGDTLLVLVEVGQAPVPSFTGAKAEVDGVELFVPEPGPGPHTLYAGAPPRTAPVWDAADVDGTVDPNAPRVVPGPRTANPGFTPMASRAELVAPGRPLDPARWSTARDVEGAGFVRVPIPPEVIARARPDLGDLRLVDADGRQIPYLRRPARREAPLEGLETERDDRPGRTRVRIRLPEQNLASVVLAVSTDATVFERAVTVRAERPNRVVRHLTWRAEGAPSRLVVELPGPVPDDLWLEVDDGDDGHLPIGAIEAWTDAPELVALLPEGGASLWYGAPSAPAPDYDLAALDARWRTELLGLAAQEASLGAPRALQAAPLRWFDRVAVGGALGIFAVGLLLLLLDLLRRLPPPAPAPTPTGSPTEPTPTEPTPTEPTPPPAPEGTAG
jgi:hypothetical protein